MDFLQLLKDYGPSVLSGAGGFGGAAFRFYQRINSLAKQVKNFDQKLDGYVLQQTSIGTQLAGILRRLDMLEQYEIEQKIGAQIDDLKRAMKLEIDSHRDDLETMIREVRANIRTVEDSSHDFAKEAALAQFMSQQAQRWEQIQRTLGRIEGFLKRSEHDD